MRFQKPFCAGNLGGSGIQVFGTNTGPHFKWKTTEGAQDRRRHQTRACHKNFRDALAR